MCSKYRGKIRQPWRQWNATEFQPIAAALDGLILPADSPFWKDHFPPWDWGCRCQVVPITAEEYKEIAQGGPGAAQGRVLSDVERRELERNGRLALPNGQVINVSARQDEGALRWDPRDLRIPLEDLRRAYDPEVWQRFAEDMRGARVTLADGERGTAWDWLLDPARDDARRQIMAQARRDKEMAVAIDWDTGERIAARVGTANSVSVADIIQDARKAGRRISLEHGHTPEGSDLPSPQDLMRLVSDSDVVAQLGVHVGWVRHTVRLTEEVSRKGSERLAERLFANALAMRDGKMSTADWEARFRGYVQRGVFHYEQRVGR